MDWVESNSVDRIDVQGKNDRSHTSLGRFLDSVVILNDFTPTNKTTKIQSKKLNSSYLFLGKAFPIPCRIRIRHIRQYTHRTQHTMSHIDESMWNVFDKSPCQKDAPSASDDECDEDKEIHDELRQVFTRDACDRCEYALAVDEYGYLTCTNKKCGKVYKDSVDQSAEWRYYSAEDSGSVDPTRCGMPVNPLLKESSYGCKVMCGRTGNNYQMRKIRRYTEWQSMPYREKSQYDEFQHIKTMANISGIPKIIVDEALRYHKKISEERTFRGMNRGAIIASSVYLACRSMADYTRTPKEIAEMFHIDPASSANGCKNAVLILNKMEKGKATNEMTHFHISKPVNFIERFCSRLQLNKELTQLAKFIATYVEKAELIPENTPHAVASGIIYLIADVFKLNITKQDIYAVSNISEVTINKCYKKLIVHKTKLIPKVLLKRYRIE